MASGSQPHTGLSLCHTITLAQNCAVTRQVHDAVKLPSIWWTFITVGGAGGLRLDNNVFNWENWENALARNILSWRGTVLIILCGDLSQGQYDLKGTHGGVWQLEIWSSNIPVWHQLELEVFTTAKPKQAPRQLGWKRFLTSVLWVVRCPSVFSWRQKKLRRRSILQLRSLPLAGL